MRTLTSDHGTRAPGLGAMSNPPPGSDIFSCPTCGAPVYLIDGQEYGDFAGHRPHVCAPSLLVFAYVLAVPVGGAA